MSKMCAKGEDRKGKHIFANVQKGLSQERKTRNFLVDSA